MTVKRLAFLINALISGSVVVAPDWRNELITYAVYTSKPVPPFHSAPGAKSFAP